MKTVKRAFIFEFHEKRSLKGFTLVELLLYFGLVAIFLTATVYFSWNVILGNVKAGVHQEVQENLRFASHKIQVEIRNADQIVINESAFGVNLAIAIDGAHDEADDQTTMMTDSDESWTADAWIGYTIYNTTDNSSGTIIDNGEKTITVKRLTGGTDNDWDTNDTYKIERMVTFSGSGGNYPVKFKVEDGGVLQIKRGGESWVPLTSSLVKVTDLTFTDLSEMEVLGCGSFHEIDMECCFFEGIWMCERSEHHKKDGLNPARDCRGGAGEGSVGHRDPCKGELFWENVKFILKIEHKNPSGRSEWAKEATFESSVQIR